MRDFFSQYWRPWQCLYREGRHRNGFRQYHSAVVLRVELLSPHLLGNDTFLLPTWVNTGKCHSWGFSDSFGPPQMPGTCRNLNEKMRLRQVSCLKVVVIWCFCTFATGSTNTKIGMKKNIIGREQEIEKLENYLSEDESTSFNFCNWRGQVYGCESTAVLKVGKQRSIHAGNS